MQELLKEKDQFIELLKTKITELELQNEKTRAQVFEA